MSRRKPEGPGPAGLLLVDKPRGWTSHDVVSWARARLGTRRIGHAGTLDPLATGLLPLLAGPATRLVDYLHGWSKTYTGEIVLGHESETGDLEGLPADFAASAPLPPRDVLDAARRRLTGAQWQVPPVYSAKKQGGTPAHRLARRGRAPVLPAVRVVVHALRLAPAGPGRLRFAARVSSGTYIRALARDLGRLLGTGACLAALRRTGIGPLRVREAVLADRALAAADVLPRLLPPESIPLPLPSAAVDAAGAALFGNGRAVAWNGTEDPAAGAIRVLGPAGALLGVAVPGPGPVLQPRVVLVPAPPRDPAEPAVAGPPSRG